MIIIYLHSLSTLFKLGTKMGEYLLKVDDDGKIVIAPFDEDLKTAADNSVRAARTVRMTVEQMHAGNFFS